MDKLYFYGYLEGPGTAPFLNVNSDMILTFWSFC